MVNDPLGDMIVQIKNAALAGKSHVELPYSNLKYEVAKVLVKEGYLVSVEKAGEVPKKTLTITLRYKNNKSVITDLKRKSKPGLRVYVGKKEIQKVVGGMGIAVISTSGGIMTGKDARIKGHGGELICEIW
jgi:small subunit ribosomal protein S8